MSKSASLETTPGPVLLPTPEVQQAQQLLARQQLAVAMDRARHAADAVHETALDTTQNRAVTPANQLRPAT